MKPGLFDLGYRPDQDAAYGKRQLRFAGLCGKTTRFLRRTGRRLAGTSYQTVFRRLLFMQNHIQDSIEFRHG